MKKAKFPLFFNLPFFNSIEKSLVSLSKIFNDKRQKRNFLVLMLSIVYHGNSLLSLVEQIVNIKKYWKASLSRFLSSSLWNKHLIEKARLKYSRQSFKDIKYIVLDFTSLVKKGKYFEYLCSVYDGRDGKIKNGYSFLLSLGLDKNCKLKNPLLWELISYKYQFRSQPLKIKDILNKLNNFLKTLKNKDELVFLADRGFSSHLMFKWLLDNNYQFFIRVIGNKKAKIKNGNVLLLSNFKDGVYEDVEILKWNLKFKLVIKTEIKNNKKEKFIFFCCPNLEIKSLKQAQKLYAKRWIIDAWIKELKQNYGLEKFRVRSFKAIEKIISLTLFAYQIVERTKLKYQTAIQETQKLVFATKQSFTNSIYHLRNLAQKISFFGATLKKPLQILNIFIDTS